MNQAIKAYFFIPSGFRNFIEYAFDGWRFIFFLYGIFSAVLAFEAASTIKEGVYIFLLPIVLLIVMSLLSSICALILGAREPVIKAMRLVAICLPPIALTVFFIARNSLLVYFAIYPIALFVFGSAFLTFNHKFLNALVGLFTIAAVIVLTYFHATFSDKWLGQELSFDGYKVNLRERPILEKSELKVYSFLLIQTPALGHLPQLDEIVDSLNIKRGTVWASLLDLDEKERIVRGADGEIRYAYPWAMYDQGYRIYIRKPDGKFSGPLYAANSIYALGISTLFKNVYVRVSGRIKDTGEKLEISLLNGKIESSNYPEVQVYKSEILSENEFYSSPAGAKASYRGRYDATRLLNLERAAEVSSEIMQQTISGVF
jgi:hypothetical protein